VIDIFLFWYHCIYAAAVVADVAIFSRENTTVPDTEPLGTGYWVLWVVLSLSYDSGVDCCRECRVGSDRSSSSSLLIGIQSRGTRQDVITQSDQDDQLVGARRKNSRGGKNGIRRFQS